MKTALLFLAAIPGFAQISFVNAVAADDLGFTGASVQTAATSHTTGNLLWAVVSYDSFCGPTFTLTDTAGNTWTKIGSNIEEGSFVTCTSHYQAINITGNASNQVTVTTSANAAGLAMSVLQFSGIATVSPRDQNTSGIANPATSITSSAFTTTTADQVVVAGVAVYGASRTFTQGAGYTIPSGATSGLGTITSQYRIVSAIQTSATTSMTISTNSFAGMAVATFKGSGVAPSGAAKRRIL